MSGREGDLRIAGVLTTAADTLMRLPDIDPVTFLRAMAEKFEEPR